jgi:tetratricopeptide (TPR) repeat protein
MRDWKDAVDLKPETKAQPFNQAVTYWAHAVAAGHLRNATTAREAVRQFDAMVDATKRGLQAFRPQRMEAKHDEAAAWLAFTEDRNDEGVKLLRAVADKQDVEGKGEIELPAREMLADMLLEMGRPEDALTEYEKSLKTDPNRFNGLAGAAKAAGLVHQPDKAKGHYAQLLKNCEGQQTDRPELAHARSVSQQRYSDHEKGRRVSGAFSTYRKKLLCFCGWTGSELAPSDSAYCACSDRRNSRSGAVAFHQHWHHRAFGFLDEGQRAFGAQIDPHKISQLDLAGSDQIGQWKYEVTFDRPLQVTGSILGIRSLVQQETLHLGGAVEHELVRSRCHQNALLYHSQLDV